MCPHLKKENSKTNLKEENVAEMMIPTMTVELLKKEDNLREVHVEDVIMNAELGIALFSANPKLNLLDTTGLQM